jgi:hypothetical protein
MTSLNCPKCGAASQSDSQIKNCPSCGAAAETQEAPKQSVAGVFSESDSSAAAVTHRETLSAEAAGSPAPAVAAPDPTAAAPAATTPTVPTPAPAAAQTAPAESTSEKVLTGVAIGLEDVSAVAKLIGDSFAGTPIAAIFKLLGPAAGIGAAVLAQHLQSRGFDLSTLKDAEIL